MQNKVYLTFDVQFTNEIGIDVAQTNHMTYLLIS